MKKLKQLLRHSKLAWFVGIYSASILVYALVAILIHQIVSWLK